MRHSVLAIAATALVALDWAALDDITTGREPGFLLEWTMLVASVPAFGALAWYARRHRPRS